MEAREDEQRAEPAALVPHDAIKEFVCRAWDGELSGAEERALAAHLSDCPECAEAAARMREFLAFLDSVRPAEPEE